MSGGANNPCPRCGEVFRCGANDAEPCACSTVPLDTATLAALRASHSGCLCLACLRAVAAASVRSPADPDSVRGG